MPKKIALTVRELIDELLVRNPNAEVVDSRGEPITSVEVGRNSKVYLN